MDEFYTLNYFMVNTNILQENLNVGLSFNMLCFQEDLILSFAHAFVECIWLKYLEESCEFTHENSFAKSVIFYKIKTKVAQKARSADKNGEDPALVMQIPNMIFPITGYAQNQIIEIKTFLY